MNHTYNKIDTKQNVKQILNRYNLIEEMAIFKWANTNFQLQATKEYVIIWKCHVQLSEMQFGAIKMK